MRNKKISIEERLVSAITYFTMGCGGVLYCIYAYFRKINLTYFVRYNIFQSIFLSLLYFCIALAIGLIMTFLSYIPGIKYIAAQLSFLFNEEILGDYSFVQIIVFGIILYASILSFFGRIPRIYWVSRIIDRQAD